MSIFLTIAEDTMGVYMDDFYVVGVTFDDYLSNLIRDLQ